MASHDSKKQPCSAAMRILVVSDVSINRMAGGAERVLYEQSKRLRARGHQVVILTRKLPKHKVFKETIQGIQENRYDVNLKNPVAYLWATFRNSKALFESLQANHGFQVAVIHQPFSALGLMSSRLSKPLKKIYVCHSLSFEEYMSRNPRPKVRSGKITYKLNCWARKMLERWALNKADRIIVLSEYTKRKLVAVYAIPPDKVSVVAGGTDVEKFRPAETKPDIRKAYHLPPEKTILFTVRNLVPRMGLEGLVAAFSKAIKTVDNLHLVIGGEGELREDLQKLAQDLYILEHISFVGYIPDDTLPDYYRMADLFILPTKELEGFGLVTVEALASGLPVIGTPVGGTKEILSGFDTSFLFKDSTPGAMAALIIEKVDSLKNEPDKWHAVASACRQFAIDNYSWEHHIDALEEDLCDLT